MAIGITPILLAGLLALFIYDMLPNVIGIMLIGFLLILSLYIGYSMFKKVQIIGLFEFMTAANAASDLDNLKLSSDSSTKERTPEEFAKLISEKSNLFKGGALRIFNDWFGQPYDNVLSIQNGLYDNETKVLTLEFEAGEKLEIFNPSHIRESPTFLKIISADRIKLTWFDYGKSKIVGKNYFVDYQKDNKKIKTQTNVDWYKPVFDVSVGSPALMIFGKIIK